MNKLFFFSAMILTVISCTENSQETESKNSIISNNMNMQKPSIDASLENKINYTEFHFLKLASFISTTITNDEIENIIFEKGLINNNNATILVENLVEEICKISNQSDEIKKEIKISLDAFKDLEGSNWKPI